MCSPSTPASPSPFLKMSMADAQELTAFLRSLRSVRRFSSEPIADDVLYDILEVARWTGSSKNTQPWRLVVVRQRATLETLALLCVDANDLSDIPSAAARTRGVAAGRSPRLSGYNAQRACERSCDWRRGRHAPPTRNSLRRHRLFVLLPHLVAGGVAPVSHQLVVVAERSAAEEDVVDAVLKCLVRRAGGG